jgi:hypothetical protein
MTFTVVWKNTAEDALAELWIRYEHYRDALSDAANQIDALLRVDPQRKGRPYITSSRVLLVPPLGVIFRVIESDRIVRILQVWYIPLHTTNGFK